MGLYDITKSLITYFYSFMELQFLSSSVSESFLVQPGLINSYPALFCDKINRLNKNQSHYYYHFGKYDIVT